MSSVPTTATSSSAQGMANSLLPFLSSSLRQFTSSSALFRILYTHPPTRLPPPSALPLKTLYILDSSFNPPSRAHRWIARDAVLSAVRQSTNTENKWEGVRLLLLLATQNADKPGKPAGFEDRLVMMVMMARQLYAELLETTTQTAEGQHMGMFMVDVGVIKQPYFVDKAAAIDDSGVYGEKGRAEQVHLTGFDTLTRIFDRKYYGEEGLGVLRPFLANGRVRVLLRPGGAWGKMNEQKGWVEEVRAGKRGTEGIEKEWAERIDLVEDEEGVVEGVSSTRIREGVKTEDWNLVQELVGEDVKEWIKTRRLYLEDG